MMFLQMSSVHRHVVNLYHCLMLCLMTIQVIMEVYTVSQRIYLAITMKKKYVIIVGKVCHDRQQHLIGIQQFKKLFQQEEQDLR
ncbi:hypothetical protein G9C98_001376 [Cotesia typhae]|uniref:Uncharacterized protein n=1 Tax=Cotesia typhae TaxID=2053667 RepID=A0A8J5UNU5_9HYME|nr:hypothetical protein G9C98_001376 [Cotesia typhae]